MVENAEKKDKNKKSREKNAIARDVAARTKAKGEQERQKQNPGSLGRWLV